MRIDPPPPTLSGLEEVIQNVVMAALGLAGVVFFVLLVIGGFKYLISGGDPKSLEGAKKTLTSAIAGLLIILLSYLIMLLIQKITGVDVTTFRVVLP